PTDAREIWERRQARCILSYFLMNQLYPGIRYKDLKRRGIALINIAAEFFPGRILFVGARCI
ncbi:MAG: hypothetical protein WC412_03055, partial [Candidatus Omnitrophota bacterium]